jgi:pimeloyl-ACP methyl ester carboxylesterase
MWPVTVIPRRWASAVMASTKSGLGKLTVPVLAIGGKAAFGTMMATVMRFAAADVREAIIPDSGHWIMEENPSATTQLVTDFLNHGGGRLAAA